MDAQVRSKYRRVANAEVYCRAVTAALGVLSVDGVRAVDVSRMIADYRRKAPVAAMRLLSFTKHFFAWTVGFGYVDRSPASDVEPRAFGVQENARERKLESVRMPDDLPHVRLLRFLLLTGLRIAEAQKATLAATIRALVAFPRSTEDKKPHRVDLPPLARAQLERTAGPHLFTSVSPTAVQAAVHRWHDRHEVTDRWTPHDLRRTFASCCGDIGIPPHIIAKLLNHTIPGGDSPPVYLRSEWQDERKEASERLAAHVGQLVSKQ